MALPMGGKEQILDSSSWLNTNRAAHIRLMNVAQLVQASPSHFYHLTSASLSHFAANFCLPASLEMLEQCNHQEVA
jgi:hypothetical protein